MLMISCILFFCKGNKILNDQFKLILIHIGVLHLM